MADLSRVVTFTNVRLSFPNLVSPQVTKAPDGSDRISYNAAFLMLPNDPNFAKFMVVVNQMAAEKWKDQAPLVMNHIQRDTKGRCYAQGEEKVNSKTLKPYDGYEGHIVISAGNKHMPQMIDAHGAPVPAENTMACQAIARKLYAGCRVNVALKPWLQENTHGRAVRCEVVAIQFHADDKPFGEGHVDVTGLFGATPEAAAAAPGFAAAPWAPPAAAAPAAPAWAPPATTKPSFM